jgi:hypothetical protein
MVVILVVNLVKNLSNGVGSEIAVSDRGIDEVNHLGRLWALVRQSIVKVLIPLLKELELNVIEVGLPIVRPALSEWVPRPGARLGISILGTGHVILSIST